MILSFGIAVIAWGLGRFLIGSSAGYSWSRLERLFIAFALGYGVLAYAVYFIGLVGGFRKEVLLPLFAGMGMLSVAGLVFLFKSDGRARFGRFKKLIENREQAWFAILAAFLIGLLILGAFLPPTAHDALCYHLNIPKRWTQDGVIGFYPNLVNSLFPFLIQIYYGVGILFQVDYAAHFFHLCCATGTALGVFALARRFAGNWAGWAAALILISTPGIFNQANLPLNDIALMFFSFAMAYAIYLGVENSFALRFFIIAGMLGGFALGIKYFAVLPIVAAGVAALIFAIKQKVSFARITQIICLFGLFTFLFGGAWYIRSWLLEGNPLYPYFSKIFGQGQGGDLGYDFAKQGYGKGLFDLFLIPWRATMEPQNFGGTWSQIGLLYLVFFPVLFIKQNISKIGFWKIVAATYFLSWFFVVQNLRFLYFILPILAVLIALKARTWRWVLYPLLVLNAAFAVYHSKDALVYWGKQESKGVYLERADETYEVIQEVNQLVPAGEKILVSDLVRLYYLNAEPIRSEEFFQRTGLSWDDKRLDMELRKTGIRWVMVKSVDGLQFEAGSALKTKHFLLGDFMLYELIEV